MVTSIYNAKAKAHDQSCKSAKETERQDHTGEKESNDRSRKAATVKKWKSYTKRISRKGC